jgi:hypothetical protein
MLERQIQFLAKIVGSRKAGAEEIEHDFPGVDAGERWQTLVRLHWSRLLDVPFNLSEAIGVDAERYETVQNFARIDASHEQRLVDFIMKTNPAVIISFLDGPAAPDEEGWT